MEGLDSIPLHHRSPWWCCGTLIKTWEHKRPQRKKKTASGEEFFSKQGKKKKRTSELNREGSKKLSEISRRENVQGRMTHYIRVWITESYLNLTFISFWFCDQKQITQHHWTLLSPLKIGRIIAPALGLPGGPVLKTLHFHCRGHGLDPC